MLKCLQVPCFPTVDQAVEMLRDREANSTVAVDGVVISSPTHTHMDVISKVAHYGLDMLTEKPIAETASRIDRLFDLAESSANTHQPFRSVALCCSFQRRFDPSYIAAATADVGKPVTARLFFADHPAPPREFLTSAGSDVFTDLAAHDVDYITSVWQGQSVNTVYATTGANDSATLVLGFEGGT